ncbi:MAG: aspartate aminotransferase family protein [Chlamydiae bacterium]|nr:MAG: aspartate aminotransferase family protein [Chlamydiota bacterium]
MAKYSLKPVNVKKINTKYRTIQTKLPVPESLEIFNALNESEPVSMMGQPPIIWDKAEGFTIYDKWGNKWLDWSSCVLVANAGHGIKEIKDALLAEIKQGLLGTYVFVHEKRAELTKALKALSPDPDNYKVFLLSTGSEATENCIKLARTYALEKYGPQKKYFLTFNGAFHGRTLGAQLAGGLPGLKNWIQEEGVNFIQVPFPDGFRQTDVSFDVLLKSLKEQGIDPENIAGMMTESYQGIGPFFLPYEYARKLEKFCKKYDIVSVYDEVQAGFGRSGKMFTYEHYDVTPDLIACGKGISSSLPLSAVIGRKDIMALYGPGSMTSTHSASPLPVAASLASLKVIQERNLVANAAELGDILFSELERIQKKYPDVLGITTGKGLVMGIQCVVSGTKEPNAILAQKINEKAFHKGLLMFAPVGIGGSCLKIAPPLCTTKEALLEGIQTFEEAVDEVLSNE